MTSENQSTAVAAPTARPPAVKAPSAKKTFEQLVESPQFKAQIALALPKTITPERFIRVLMTATIKNPQLLDCTQESMFKGIFDCAALGLEIDGRRAHLVPLRNSKKAGSPLEANLWIDYKGLAELVMRSGVVSSLHTDIVCENDTFEYDRGELKAHKIDFRKPRGDMYAAYCIIRMKDGGEKVEVMSKDQIDRIRSASMGKNLQPWTAHYDEMAKKTVFKRASKWVPISPEAKDAIDLDDGAIEIETVKAPEIKKPLFGGKKTEQLTDAPQAEPEQQETQAPEAESPPAPDKQATLDVLEGRMLDGGLSLNQALSFCEANKLATPKKVNSVSDLPVETLVALCDWALKQKETAK